MAMESSDFNSLCSSSTYSCLHITSNSLNPNCDPSCMKLGPGGAKKVKRDKDLISQLPDDILISIISCLSTTDAVRTSLLSRRWRNLYRFLPLEIKLDCYYLLKHADFGIKTSISSQRWRSVHGFLSRIESLCGNFLAENSLHNPKLIINSVDEFLKLRSGSKIHSFRLHCCLDGSVNDRFEHCISSLGRLGVEELCLTCCCSYSDTSDLSFSCHLFSEMPSLKYLRLSKCSLQPSSRIQYNSLQTLVLMFVEVSRGAIECILSNCLKLQSLSINCCKCPHKLSVRGPHLELKRLYIDGCQGVGEIELYASNLILFQFDARKMVNLRFDHVPQLQSMILYVVENIVPYVFGRLPIDVPHLKSMHFVTAGDSLQVSNGHTGIDTLSNLRRLDVNMNLSKMNLLSLVLILRRCPLLQEFGLNTNGMGNEPEVEEQPIVFHSELKKMEIGGFNGTKNEMEFALYILKSAINLVEMHISRCCKVYLKSREGPGTWISIQRIPWSKNKYKTIHERLQGQAVSKTAQVIIQ
ncbi:hypothetical protein ABFS82_03G109000 [Erythranthe guttata]